MKGITPVIAIILLLLMAVAAAGGFYFVYQQFSASGTESGSTQIEQLGQTALSAITIESVAGGTIYVRNVGAQTIDLTNAQVFMDNVPVEFQRAGDTLAENSRTFFSLSRAVSCARERCEIKIVAPGASATRQVTPEQVTSSCGDGTCTVNERMNLDCFGDCGLSPLPSYRVYGNPATSNLTAVVYAWNGTGLEFSQNLSSSMDFTSSHAFTGTTSITYSPAGEVMFIASRIYDTSTTTNDIPNLRPVYGFYDGSNWSELADFGEINSTIYVVPDFGFYPSGSGMAIWNVRDPREDTKNWLQYALWDGTSFSAPQNYTLPDGTLVGADAASLEVLGEDDLIVSFRNGTPGGGECWLSTMVWDGSEWSDLGTIPGSYYNFPDRNCGWTDIIELGADRYLTTWVCKYSYYCDGCEWATQYSVYNGETWSEIQNLTTTVDIVSIPRLYEDVFGRTMLVTAADNESVFKFFSGSDWSDSTTMEFAGGTPVGGDTFTNNGYLSVMMVYEGAAKIYNFDGEGFSEEISLSGMVS